MKLYVYDMGAGAKEFHKIENVLYVLRKSIKQKSNTVLITKKTPNYSLKNRERKSRNFLISLVLYKVSMSGPKYTGKNLYILKMPNLEIIRLWEHVKKHA